MTSVGDTLRRERLQRKLDLDQISRELKISRRLLDAIETDQYDLLPGSLEMLADPTSEKVMSGLRPSVTALTAASLERAYTQCFGHAVSKDCSPCEAEYGQAHIFQKTHTLADVAGFYRAFGLDLAADSHERVDHISVELEFMHFLCLKEAYALAKNHPHEQLALCREAQSKFLRDHVCRWAFGFAHRVCAKASDTLYQGLGQLLAAFLAAELRALGMKPAEVAGPDLIVEEAQALPEEGTSQRSSCEISCGLGGTR